MKRLVRLAVSLSEKTAVFQVTIAEYTIALVGLMMMYGVVMRYVFKQGIPWTWEIPEWLFLVITTLTLAYAQKERRHINVDLLVSRLPQKGQNIIKAFAHLVFFIFCIILLRAAIIRLTHDWIVHSQLTKLPVAPLLIVLCIGLVFLMLQLLVDMGRELAEFSRKPVQDGK